MELMYIDVSDVYHSDTSIWEFENEFTYDLHAYSTSRYNSTDQSV